MKRSDLVFNGFTLIVSGTMLWLCGYYPIRLCIVRPEWSVLLSLLAGIIVFGVNFYLLTMFFASDRSLISDNMLSLLEPVSDSSGRKKFLACFAVQVAFDVVTIILSSINAALLQYVQVLYIPLAAARWFTLYAVLTRKKNGVFASKKLTVILVALCVALTAAFTALAALSTERYRLLSGVYDIQSYAELPAALNNINFNMSVRYAEFETLIGLSFIALHYFAVRSADCGKSKVKATRAATASAAVIVAACALFVAKSLIYREGSFKSFTNTNVSSESFENNPGYSVSAPTFNRFAYPSGERAAYQRTHVLVTYKGSEAASYWVDGDRYGTYDPNHTPVAAGTIEIRDEYRTLSVGGREVYIFDDKLMCYVENDLLKCVKFDELDEKSDESELVTATLERLLSDGDVGTYIAARRYADKYLPSVAQPMNERIRSGKLTSAEDGYRQHYGYSEGFAVLLD